MRALRRSKEAVKCFRYSTLVPLPTQTKGGEGGENNNVPSIHTYCKPSQSRAHVLGQ